MIWSGGRVWLSLPVAVAALLAAPAAGRSLPGAACGYRSGGALPDRVCTPGALNPAVSQATVGSTICSRGWTSTVRPPLAVTEPEKFRLMRAYGVPTSPGHAGLYELDHLVPLELGGAVDGAANLWPEPHAASWRGRQVGSFVKDGVEAHLNALVCSGRLTLARARAVMMADWRVGAGL